MHRARARAVGEVHRGREGGPGKLIDWLASRLSNELPPGGRCAACVFTGGTTPRTQQEAEEVAAVVQVLYPDRDVAVGEHVALDPCVPEHDQARILALTRGARACHYVPLLPRNLAAAEIAFAAVQEHMQPLVGPTVAAYAAVLDPDEHLAMLERVRRALSSRMYVDHLKAVSRG